MNLLNVIKKNKLKLIYGLFLLLISCVSIAQEEWYHYDWASQKRVNNVDEYTYAYSYGLKKYENNKFIGQHNKQFALEGALSVYSELGAGYIYTGLPEYESYIKKVLSTIVKDTMVTNRIKIHFSRDDEMNASMNATGFLTINIGLISSLDNEAELAWLLGHEVAHFLNDDMLRNYSRLIDLKYVDNSRTYWGFFMQYNSFKNYYWFSREQESAADQLSLQLLKVSPYSLAHASSLLRKFKRSEIRNEIKHGKRSSNFTTHPDPGDRLSQIKQMLADPTEIHKKKFIVDSSTFIQLKDLCYKETINLGLMNNNLVNLINLTFSRYLLEPEDKNNLAVLIESLRRLLIQDTKSKVCDKSFILSDYQTKWIQESENYAFLKEKEPSILNHLNKGFVDIWKEDFNKIKAIELRDSTITEFSTNMEAYLYFKEKARSSNNTLAQHYNYFGINKSFSDVDTYTKQNNLFVTNDYLFEKGSVPESTKDLIIVIPPNAQNVAHILGDVNFQQYTNGNNLLVNTISNTLGMDVLTIDDLNFNETHLLNSMMNQCYFYLNFTSDPVIRKDKVNWIEVCPEIYSFFKNRGVGNIYVYTAKLLGEKEMFADFFKISLPRANSYTFYGQRKYTKLGAEDEVLIDRDKISKQIKSFYSLLSEKK